VNRRDRNFDDLAERFARNIYGSAKGEIRLAIVWQHLMQTLPQLTAEKPLRILDAGCGFGQLAMRLAQLGHEMVLSDLSEKMLNGAEHVFADQLPQAKVEFIHAPVQTLSGKISGQFDLVLFHAVLEWLAEPQQTLQQLLQLIKPGGHLSLLFYNRDALIFRNLMRGNWRKVESGEYQGEEGSLTPYHPLSLQEVEGWLQAWKMQILSHTGVRVIYDYMDKQLRDSRPVDEVVRMELQYACQEPYLHLGRYLHVVARKE
jgi:S-adenosylmethionine-dependent methyltransferase